MSKVHGGEPSPPPPPPVRPQPPAPEARAFTGRAAFAIAQIYYYGAAVVGVGFVIGGAIGALVGLRQLVLPDPGHEAREAVRQMLMGVAFALPGLGFAWWHLREARGRESALQPGAFWGRSLYFHLVSFVGAVTALGGVSAMLVALVDAALPPECRTFFGAPGDSCPDTSDALRRAVNAAIVVLVAGAVWWWHLREARRGGRVTPSGTTSE